jgi:hypothetical protein
MTFMKKTRFLLWKSIEEKQSELLSQVSVTIENVVMDWALVEALVDHRLGQRGQVMKVIRD